MTVLVFVKCRDGSLEPGRNKNQTALLISSKELAEATLKLSDLFKDNKSLDHKVDSLFATLSIQEKAAQMIMPATSLYPKIGIPFARVKETYLENKIGGVLFLKGTEQEFTRQITELNRLTQSRKKLPMLFSCDCEPTLFHRKFTDADSLLPASALNDSNSIALSVEAISREMSRMGIHLNFAPVADNAKNTEIIGNRAFSSDPDSIVSNASQFIQYMQERFNIGATVKHFPGHGSMNGDSHKSSVYIDGELSELETFASIIRQAQPVAVMVGHMNIRNNPAFPANTPASVNWVVINELLKKNLQYRGIVVTDGMQMEGVKHIPNASWKALVAGADIVLMPQDINVIHRQLVAELESGSMLSRQFERSIKKILRLKLCSTFNSTSGNGK